MAKPPRDRRREAARQRTYIRLRARVDHLEDAISHFYNVINELRGLFRLWLVLSVLWIGGVNVLRSRLNGRCERSTIHIWNRLAGDRSSKCLIALM